MSKKLQTIYEYLHEYSEEEINFALNELSVEEKALIEKRYGCDLDNPVSSTNWSKIDSKEFYGKLIPKIKRMLSKKEKETEPSNETVIVSEPTKIEEKKDISMLFYLLRNGKNNREICEILHMEPKELYEELLKLKNDGIRFSKKYYSDGSIKYKNVSSIQELNNYKITNQNRTIITDMNENSMKVLLISDLHLGNEKERLDLINRAFNYCIKNGIHIILCGGDLIDGAFTQGRQKITNIYKQIEYFIKNYPYDKNILTFSVGGDHDLSALTYASVDLIEVCNNYRHDIIIGGYNNTQINLKNDKIHLYHHIGSGTMRKTDAPIILHGHSHKYSTEMRNNALNITIPTLSDINELMPSALELDLEFSNGYITNSLIKHIHFGSSEVILSEAAFDMLKRRTMNEEEIKNTELYRQDLSFPMTLKRTLPSLSQIDKFNKRYGLK